MAPNPFLSSAELSKNTKRPNTWVVRAFVPWLLIAAGCGQVGFDAVTDAGPSPDARRLIAFDQVQLVTNTNEVEFMGRCTGVEDILFSGISTERAPCEGERFAIRVSSTDEAVITLTAVQGMGQAEAEWVRDVTPPTITDTAVPITVATPTVPVRVSARDTLDEVAALCFDTESDIPSDSCFIELGAAPLGPAGAVVDVGPFMVSIGSTPGEHTIHISARDRAGNISAVTTRTVTYTP